MTAGEVASGAFLYSGAPGGKLNSILSSYAPRHVFAQHQQLLVLHAMYDYLGLAFKSPL